MKEATYYDAVEIARLYNVHKDDVWAVICGMRYMHFSELTLAVLNYLYE